MQSSSEGPQKECTRIRLFCLRSVYVRFYIRLETTLLRSSVYIMLRLCCLSRVYISLKIVFSRRSVFIMLRLSCLRRDYIRLKKIALLRRNVELLRLS